MASFRIKVEPLKNFAAALLAAGGFTSVEAKAIAESLILSESMGHGSHGVMRVKEYLNDLKKGATVSGVPITFINETENSLLVDAQQAAGQVVMPAVLKKLASKLESQAVVSAAIRGSGHIGRMGEWVEIPAYAGYAALLMANDNGTCFHVAPPGGKKSVTSTNPIAFAIPMPDGEVFLTDMSTSAIAFGKVKLARINHTSVSPDCIQDAHGHATRDPNALFADPAGSIMPMGGAQGYKGFALSMFIDLLVAGLSGGYAPPAPAGARYANNLTFVLWNPKFFSGLEHMQNEARKYMDFVRACPPSDTTKPIRIPGDRLKAIKQEREKNGVPLDDGLVKNLLILAKELNVAAPAELAGAP